MVTTLYLIRHGETEGAQSNRYKGHIDVPLSEKGIAQMKKVSAFIFDTETRRYGEGEKITVTGSPRLRVPDSMLSAVYTSDLSRAVKSAEIITEPYGLKPIIMPELRERNFGIWEGMSFDEIKEKYPKEFEAWVSNHLEFSPMGGESTIEVKKRVIDALDRILSNHKGKSTEQSPPTHPSPSRGEGKGGGESLSSVFCNLCSENIAIVSHGGVNRIILCHLLGIPLENIFGIEQDYAALNIIEFWDEYPVVKLINYIV